MAAGGGGSEGPGGSWQLGGSWWLLEAPGGGSGSVCWIGGVWCAPGRSWLALLAARDSSWCARAWWWLVIARAPPRRASRESVVFWRAGPTPTPPRRAGRGGGVWGGGALGFLMYGAVVAGRWRPARTAATTPLPLRPARRSRIAARISVVRRPRQPQIAALGEPHRASRRADVRARERAELANAELYPI